jgi:hypothetical protein
MSENSEKDLSSIATSIPTASKLFRSRTSVSRSSESTQDDSYFSDFSSTDAGDDIATTFVDFDDASSSSDGEPCNDQSFMTPCRQTDVTVQCCVYSVMMLLRLRAAACGDEDDSTPVRYGTRSMSDLPASPSTKRRPVASPPTEADASDSWRALQMALPAVADDSWLAQQRKRDTAEDATVLRAARSILNKLTVERFDSLFEQLTTCGINHPHHISLLMREVFEKATTQHHFIPMYAELCVKLEGDPRIAAVVDEADQSQNFKRLLLNECQHVFEQLFDSDNVTADADEEMVFRRKQKALGNMKLVGHLLVHGMLSPDLFVECCEELLQKHTLCPEALLESLVALLMVAGPKFDYSEWQYSARLGQILAALSAMTKDKSVAPRLRFLIRDVLDARDAGWPSSLIGKSPAKLEEVRNSVSTPQHIPEPPTKECPPVPPWRSKAAAKTLADGSEDKAESCKQVKKKVQFSWEEKIEPCSTPEIPTEKAFDVVTFRRTLATIFSDLASDKDIPGAVQRVRLEKVPVALQPDQYADILTRIVEERRGAVRRCELAFLTGLAAAEQSAFDREACLAGIGLFFKDVYGSLCDEVHRLPAIMKSEFLPTVLSVFTTAELNKVVPVSMRR